jgi:hypothetical protein
MDGQYYRRLYLMFALFAHVLITNQGGWQQHACGMSLNR